MRFLLAQRGDDGRDAVGDLLGAVAAHVVGADHQHGRLRRDAFQFLALGDAPKDVLRAIAADAEIGGLQRIEAFLPHVFAAAFPSLRDRVAQEQHLDIALLGTVEKALVPVDRTFVLAFQRLDGAVFRFFVFGLQHAQTEAQHGQQPSGAGQQTTMTQQHSPPCGSDRPLPGGNDFDRKSSPVADNFGQGGM